LLLALALCRGRPGIAAQRGAVSLGATDLAFAIMARDLLGLRVEPGYGDPGATAIFWPCRVARRMGTSVISI
jgi:hypothetical protein